MTWSSSQRGIVFEFLVDMISTPDAIPRNRFNPGNQVTEVEGVYLPLIRPFRKIWKKKDPRLRIFSLISLDGFLTTKPSHHFSNYRTTQRHRKENHGRNLHLSNLPYLPRRNPTCVRGFDTEVNNLGKVDIEKSNW